MECTFEIAQHEDSHGTIRVLAVFCFKAFNCLNVAFFADDTSSMPSMAHDRNATVPICALPLRRFLPMLLWGRIRPIRTPKLNLPIVLLARAVRVTDSLPVRRRGCVDMEGIHTEEHSNRESARITILLTRNR